MSTTTLTPCPPRWATRPKYDQSFGPDLCDFADDYAVITSESLAADVGDPVDLRAWQRDLFNDLLEVRDDGRYRHRTALIGLPGKNGKSFLGSILALYWLTYGPENAVIIGAASTRKQARLVFDTTKKMVKASPDLCELIHVAANHLENLQTGAIYRVVSAEAGGEDGLVADLVIVDELHRLPNHDLWSVLTKSIATKGNGMVVAITTAGHDRQSLCFELFDYGCKVASGEIADETFFIRWWAPADPDCDHRDPAVHAACNPQFGDTLDPAELLIAASRDAENEFRRFRLNLWTKTFSQWLKFGAFEACRSDPPKPLAEGDEIVIGFDGSWSNDTTALVACRISDLHLVVLDAWEKDPEADDWRVPVGEVEDAIRRAGRLYRVREISADPSGWKQSLTTLSDEGFLVFEFPQGSDALMTAATRAFEDSVYDRKVSHDGDRRLVDHVGNCITKPATYSDGHRLVKRYKGSSRKIDVAMAAVFALHRALTYQVGGPNPSVLWIDEDEDPDDDWWDTE